MPANRTKPCNISCFVTVEFKQTVEHQAQKRGISSAKLVEEALLQYFSLDLPISFDPTELCLLRKGHETMRPNG